MPLQNITRFSQEILNQNYRGPGVAPGPVPPSEGGQNAPDDPTYASAGEFIRILPFVSSEMGAPARAYQVGSAQPLAEPPFTAKNGGTPWVPGATTAFGQELSLAGARFKRVSILVRSDDAMGDGHQANDMQTVQVKLGQAAVVRALEKAIFASVPANDDMAELAGLPFFLPANSSQDVLFDDAQKKMIGGLSEIEARCAPSDGDVGAGPDVFVMSSRARWRLLKEMEDKGVTPDFKYSEITRQVQLHFHGVPVLRGRVPEPATPAPTTEAWALKLFGPSGVHIVHVGGDSEQFGLRSEPTDTVATLDATGEAQKATLGTEVFGVYALLVPEIASIARLRGIPSRDPFLVP